MSIIDQAAAIQKVMADMVKLQITEQAKRTGDKENNIINLVNWGTVLYRYITAICYYIMATYRYLPFFASAVMTKAEAYLVKIKYSQYRN